MSEDPMIKNVDAIKRILNEIKDQPHTEIDRGSAPVIEVDVSKVTSWPPPTWEMLQEENVNLTKNPVIVPRRPKTQITRPHGLPATTALSSAKSEDSPRFAGISSPPSRKLSASQQGASVTPPVKLSTTSVSSPSQLSPRVSQSGVLSSQLYKYNYKASAPLGASGGLPKGPSPPGASSTQLSKAPSPSSASQSQFTNALTTSEGRTVKKATESATLISQTVKGSPGTQGTPQTPGSPSAERGIFTPARTPSVISAPSWIGDEEMMKSLMELAAEQENRESWDRRRDKEHEESRRASISLETSRPQPQPQPQPQSQSQPRP